MWRVLPLGFALSAFLHGCERKAPPAPPPPPPAPARDYINENVERWKGELRRWGGSWEAWEKEIAPFQEDLRAALAARPREIAGLAGLDGFLFFRRSLDVLVSGNLREQEEGRDPFPAVVDFSRQLRSKGVEMLFCPIPVKAAVFSEKISRRAPPLEGPHVSVYTRRLMCELAGAGVECVDFLPHFLEARDGPGESFYMELDTHWSHRGLRVAARVIAERIKGYPWYREVSRRKVGYAVKKVTCKRRGDIVLLLPEAERVGYAPMTLEAEQVVRPDGELYEDDKSSPIVLLGDSYAGIFHLGECEDAGLTAHIAKELGLPIDLILGQGMGPKVRGRLARRGKGALDGKKLVVWTLSERDLYNYRSPWTIIRVP